VREILRLALTLTAVAVLSASLLTGVNIVTEPIIIERQEKDYHQSLERFFPDVDHFETEEIDGDQYDIVYDQDGEMLGIMATVETAGYEAGLIYNLAVNDQGEIKGLVIVSHAETPGIGDVITTDEFQEQFTGKGFDDPIEDGEDVDSVSGATLSTGTMIVSVRRTVTTIGENFLDKQIRAFDPTEVADGIYQGSVEGTHGILTVEVEIADGVIERVDVIEQNETEAYFVDSYPKIPERIVEEQRLEVDTQTGATLSAERIVSAVEKALEEAPTVENGGDDTDEGR